MQRGRNKIKTGGLRAETPIFDDAANDPEVKEAWDVIMKRLGIRPISINPTKYNVIWSKELGPKPPTLKFMSINKLSSEDWSILRSYGIPYGVALVETKFNYDYNQIECGFQEGEDDGKLN